jgi:Dolichyl-phosphate-mannose-protein mannosyltransferase
MRTVNRPLSGRALDAGSAALGKAGGLVRRLRHDRVLAALAVLLGVGAALRIWFTLVWSPAITGYSDTGIYFDGAYGPLRRVWTDPIRTVGYSIFLRLLHGITPHLLFVIIVQHVLGLVAALLFFLAVRRCGGPRGLGLAPAAIIALGGDELFLEHSALSDALFIFLLSVMLYCAIRAAHGRLWWALGAGLSAGLGVWDRDAGMAMVAVIPLWLLFSTGRPTRRTLAVGALSLVAGLVTIGAYIEWREAASGLSGLTTNSAWNLYGRVAPWANCSKFTPPRGTRALCEATPVSRRNYPTQSSHKPRSSEYYIYDPESPAYKLLGPAYFVSKHPHAAELLTKWSEAAIVGQPLEYLHAVWLDTIRLFDPNHHSYGDYSPDEMIAFMLGGFPANSGKNALVEYWQQALYPHDPRPHRGNIAPLKEWERLTRVDGVWMAILLALCLAGPWLLGGRARTLAPRARSGMVLFGLSALTLIFFPILVKGYDYRFMISAFAPLLAAGALSAWGLVVKINATSTLARLLRRGRGSRLTQSRSAPADPHAAPRSRAEPASR